MFSTYVPNLQQFHGQLGPSGSIQGQKLPKVEKIEILKLQLMISNPSSGCPRLVQVPKDVPRSEVSGGRQNFLGPVEEGVFMDQNVFFRVRKFEKLKIFEFQKFKCTISNTLYAKV